MADTTVAATNAVAGAADGLTPEDFTVVGFTQEEANRIDRPTISYWADAWRRLRKNPVAMGALVVLGILLIMVIVGPYMRGYSLVDMNTADRNLGPSAEYWFGHRQPGARPL